ncbi:MAG: CU044_2847 family protein [Prochloraceae cyanobacterium]|nr:CU044_2847 family protein [Prochloraceae cyanobacterium]
MTKLTPLKLEDGTVIYIETTVDVQVPESVAPDEEKELTREDLGKEGKGVKDLVRGTKRLIQETGTKVSEPVVNTFEAIEQTIKAYTTHTLNAFKQVKSSANIEKVTLEFGIKVGAEGAVPYITKGTAESNLKIQVECSFPKDNDNNESENQ